MVSEVPRLEVTSVTLGAPDPRALADFYARMLGGSVVATDPPGPGQPPEDGWAQVKPPAGRLGLTLNFEYEPDYTPPTWPSEPGKQQIMEHLDIWVDDLAPAAAWAVSVGARLADYQPQDNVRVLLDPAGHPFCLFT
jgi:catechol 2,3-dioxygenase-like lactoylglutathione lyase family enzyme